MKQADIMMESEGDAWFERNRAKLGKRDPVSDIIREVGIRPERVLEIGCSNGWRLAALREKYKCSVTGVEPGQFAATEAIYSRVPIIRSTAEELTTSSHQFDVVIYGFCLYASDPEDWLRIAAEGDRVLATGGHIIVHDFAETSVPFAREYEHRDGMLSWHVDFSRLWLAHPLYSVVRRRIFAADEMVTVLKKSPASSIEVMT